MSHLEVADIFRAHGSHWRNARAGHLSLGQLKVMSAIERCRTVALGGHVWKDYRAKECYRHKTMTLTADEFIRRFLLHVLPAGFHRIRHYGLIANTQRKECLIKARAMLHAPETAAAENSAVDEVDKTHDGELNSTYVCPDCGAPMIIIETFRRGQQPRAPPLKTDRSLCA